MSIDWKTVEDESAGNLIDLGKYPLHSPASPAYGVLVIQCQQDLEERGACVLPGFITPEAAARMVVDTDRVVSNAYLCNDVHNVFLEEDDLSFPQDHPRRRKEKTSLNSVAYDQIGENDALRSLYELNPMLHFVTDVLRREKMYRMEDPFAALTVNVMREGQNHGWHFDESEVTITLMLQCPGDGGQFEFVHGTSDADRENYDAITEILDGTSPAIQSLEVHPGTLILFAGYYSIHRVTPVVGKKTRYLATLCFKDEPGVSNSSEVQQLFYGRTAAT